MNGFICDREHRCNDKHAVVRRTVVRVVLPRVTALRGQLALKLPSTAAAGFSRPLNVIVCGYVGHSTLIVPIEQKAPVVRAWVQGCRGLFSQKTLKTAFGIAHSGLEAVPTKAYRILLFVPTLVQLGGALKVVRQATLLDFVVVVDKCLARARDALGEVVVQRQLVGVPKQVNVKRRHHDDSVFSLLLHG